MTYGLSPALFVENGPAIHAAGAHARSSSDGFRAWRSLDPRSRLKLIDRALTEAANDDRAIGPDGFPVAL
jgi:hypothetical protein